MKPINFWTDDMSPNRFWSCILSRKHYLQSKEYVGENILIIDFIFFHNGLMFDLGRLLGHTLYNSSEFLQIFPLFVRCICLTVLAR